MNCEPVGALLQGVNQSVAEVRLNTRRGPTEGGGVTYIGHKARHQRLLEHRIPVHVSQVGHALDVTEAGQAALRVLGQQLRSEGKRHAVNDVSHRDEHGLGTGLFTQHSGCPCMLCLALACPVWVLSGMLNVLL